MSNQLDVFKKPTKRCHTWLITLKVYVDEGTSWPFGISNLGAISYDINTSHWKGSTCIEVWPFFNLFNSCMMISICQPFRFALNYVRKLTNYVAKRYHNTSSNVVCVFATLCWSILLPPCMHTSHTSQKKTPRCDGFHIKHNQTL